MARFNFKLQPVLNVRKQKENASKNNVAKAIRKLEKETKVLEQIGIKREEINKEINEKATVGVTINELRAIHLYKNRLSEKIKIQLQNIKLAEKEVDSERIDLVESVKQRKMMEKYKERKFNEYREAENTQEKEQLDEIVSYKYGVASVQENTKED